MSKDNHFQQYGYDHYLKSPKRPAKKSRQDSNGGGFNIGPGLMTAGLLLTGAIFAGIIVMSYPSSENSRGEIPIVKADLRPIKIKPNDRGGMDIPNRESTILAKVGEPPVQGERQEIENLLQSRKQDTVSKEEALEEAMAESSYETANAQTKPENLLQKIEPSTGESQSPDHSKLHAAGTSPEARDLLKKKMEEEAAAAKAEAEKLAAMEEVKEMPPVKVTIPKPIDPPKKIQEPKTIETMDAETQASVPSKVEPSAGFSSAPKMAVTSGNYFVQLASIRDQSRGESEWKKYKQKYGGLIDNIPYRLQEANLGARGTFYRIQVGPISKDSADKICDRIKAQNPGGCLVVKK